jgi:mono/diheme cytochrome c family protein
MKYVVTLLVGAGLAASGVAFAGQKLGAPLGDRPPEAVYAKTCGYCHGRNVGPVILGRALSPAVTSTMVRHGRNGMPAFRPTEVTNAELAALADWIAKSKAVPTESGH